MKVSELEGAEPDAAVARALGLKRVKRTTAEGTPIYAASGMPEGIDIGVAVESDDGPDDFAPSSRWDHGGALIERERISLEFYRDGWGAEMKDALGYVVPHPDPAEHEKMASGFAPAMGAGPTPLIAAMRAYVASKFGEEM